MREAHAVQQKVIVTSVTRFVAVICGAVTTEVGFCVHRQCDLKVPLSNVTVDCFICEGRALKLFCKEN
jgi:hypothetical protein